MTEVRLISEFSGDMLERIAGFYISAGWLSEGDDTSFLLPALNGSALVAGAFDENGVIIGCARCLSDGCSDAYIQDVTVDKSYRGRGIGGKLVKLLASELADRGIDWIGLVGVPGTEKFYSSLGFVPQGGHTLWLKKDE